MNFPLQRIHDVKSGYGFLLFPLFGRWLAWFDKHGLRRTDRAYPFHNCTTSGVH